MTQLNLFGEKDLIKKVRNTHTNSSALSIHLILDFLPIFFLIFSGLPKAVPIFLLLLKVKEMRNVYTIRIADEYVGMLEHIALELKERGIEVKDNVLIKTVLLTGIRSINMQITQGINIFDERNTQAND